MALHVVAQASYFVVEKFARIAFVGLVVADFSGIVAEPRIEGEVVLRDGVVCYILASYSLVHCIVVAVYCSDYQLVLDIVGHLSRRHSFDPLGLHSLSLAPENSSTEYHRDTFPAGSIRLVHTVVVDIEVTDVLGWLALGSRVSLLVYLDVCNCNRLRPHSSVVPLALEILRINLD